MWAVHTEVVENQIPQSSTLASEVLPLVGYRNPRVLRSWTSNLDDPCDSGGLHTLMPDPEQVIEVPKILPDDVPLRTAVRDPQLAEHLVEVPTIVSFSLLQRIMEQNVDIPVAGHGGRFVGLQGFPLEQSSTAPSARFDRDCCASAV